MSDGPKSSRFSLLEVTDDDRFNERVAALKFYKAAPDVRTIADRWYAWDRTRWKPTEKEAFRSIAMEVQDGSRKVARHAKAILDHVEWERQLKIGEQFRGGAMFDEDGSVLINVANGVLRVRKDGMELLPHSKDYHFLGCLAAKWDAEAQPHLFCEYLPQWLPESEDRRLLQWFAGYLFYPNCAQHEIFLLCYGEGGTGKSTMAEAILATLGDPTLVKSLSMNQLCTSGQGAYSLPGLRYALLNIGTELDTVEMDESTNFKRLISGESLEVRDIYRAPFSMSTSVKLMFLANSLPRFKHGTEAELRRARFLGFNEKITKKDTTLKERLMAEKDGVLCWMVQGLQMILAGVQCPEGGENSRRVKEKFAVSNDPVGYFVKHHCVIDAKAMTPKETFHKEFIDFLESQGFSGRSKEYLYRALYERVPQLGTVRVKAGDKWHKGLVTGKCEMEGYHVTGIRPKFDDEA